MVQTEPPVSLDEPPAVHPTAEENNEYNYECYDQSKIAPWRIHLGLESSVEQQAEQLARRLHYATDVLLERLFAYLSHLPEEPPLDAAEDATGMTLPASAIGWLSSHLYPTGEEQYSTDFCSPAHTGMWMSTRLRDRLRLLRFLLPRVTHLRITRQEWPPELPRKPKDPSRHLRPTRRRRLRGRQTRPPQELNLSTTMSVSSGLTMDDVGHHDDRPPTRQDFWRYMQALQHHPRLDMRLFPRLQVLLMESIPPTWVSNLHALQHSLHVLKWNQACLYHHLPQILMSNQSPRENPSHYQYVKLTHLNLNKCGLGELSGLRKALARCCSHLECLSLAHNEICSERTAVRGLQRATQLTKLNLSFNQLTALPKAHYYLGGQLQRLQLSHNRIETAHGIDRLFALRELWLDHNQIHHLSEIAGLSRMPELEVLYLDGNPMGKTYARPVWTLFQQERRATLPNELPRLDVPLPNKKRQSPTQPVQPRAITPKEWSQLQPGSPSLIVEVPLRQSRVHRTHKVHVAKIDAPMGNAQPRRRKKVKAKQLGARPVAFSVQDVLLSLQPPPEQPIAQMNNDPQGNETSTDIPPVSTTAKSMEGTLDHHKDDMPVESIQELNVAVEGGLAPIESTVERRAPTENSRVEEAQATQTKATTGSGLVEERIENVETNAYMEDQPDYPPQCKMPPVEPTTSSAKLQTGDMPVESIQEPSVAVEAPIESTVEPSAPAENSQVEEAQATPTKVTTSNEVVEERAEIVETSAHVEDQPTYPPQYNIPPVKPTTSSAKLQTGASRTFDVLAADWDALVMVASEGLIPDGNPRMIAHLKQDLTLDTTDHHETKVPPDLQTPASINSAATPAAPEASDKRLSLSPDAPYNKALQEVQEVSSVAGLSSINLPEQIFPDDFSVPSSLGTNRDDFPNQVNLGKTNKFQVAEENAVYDGPDACSEMQVLKNLELYFNTYVFPTSVEMPASENLLEDMDWHTVPLCYPRIQLCPDDRRWQEASLSTASQEVSNWTVTSREQFVRVWDEDVIPCGVPAMRRLFPNRRSRLGFHGEQLYLSSNSVDPYSESRKMYCCLSSSAFYIIAKKDEVTLKREARGLKKKFPIPISDEATFGIAPWPHAAARHSFQQLQAITIGFEFQRLTLRFANPSIRKADPFVYVLMTSSKKETVGLLQEIQRLAKESNRDTIDLVSDGTAVAIENDSQTVLDALQVAVAPDVVGTILHYQIVQQRWKHGEGRGTVRRVCVVTDTKMFLLDEDYEADGHDSMHGDTSKSLACPSYRMVDEATLAQVAEVQGADADPKAITIVINPLSRMSRIHRWRLVCRDSDGAERLVDAVRKAISHDDM